MLQIHLAEKSCGLDKQILSLWLLVSHHMRCSVLILGIHMLFLFQAQIQNLEQVRRMTRQIAKFILPIAFLCLSPVLAVRHLQSEIEKLRTNRASTEILCLKQEWRYFAHT